jgi:hypothetical protein
MMEDEKMARALRYRSDFRHDPNTIRDVFDGKLYRSLLGKRVTVGGRTQRHTYFGDKRDMVLGLSTNGYAPFKRRAKTAWPLLLFNYNLPLEIRFLIDTLLCVGVIPGPKKPHDWDSFVWPLMEELLQLEAGVPAWDAVDLVAFMLCVFLILVSRDMPAVSMMMHMSGTNGKCPCRFCKILGVRIPSYSMPYYVPLDRSTHPAAQVPEAVKTYDLMHLPMRSHEGFLADAHAAQDARIKAAHDRLILEHGVKGMPLLACLLSISFPFSFPYNFMHLVWENVVKNLFNLWSGTFKGVGTDFSDDDFVLSKEALAEVGKMGHKAGSSIPYAFGPRPPNLASDKVSWTAETRAFYAQHIAPSVFRRHLRAKYFKNFIDLIRLLSWCVDYEMARDKLPLLRAGFAAWVQEFEK